MSRIHLRLCPASLFAWGSRPALPSAQRSFSPPYLSPVEDHTVGQNGQLDDAEINPNYTAQLIETCSVDEGYSYVPLAAFIPPYLHGPLAAGGSCQILEPTGVVHGSGKGYGYLASAGGKEIPVGALFYHCEVILLPPK